MASSSRECPSRLASGRPLVTGRIRRNPRRALEHISYVGQRNQGNSLRPHQARQCGSDEACEGHRTSAARSTRARTRHPSAHVTCCGANGTLGRTVLVAISFRPTDSPSDTTGCRSLHGAVLQKIVFALCRQAATTSRARSVRFCRETETSSTRRTTDPSAARVKDWRCEQGGGLSVGGSVAKTLTGAVEEDRRTVLTFPRVKPLGRSLLRRPASQRSQVLRLCERTDWNRLTHLYRTRI
jgi:hypothetical protein